MNSLCVCCSCCFILVGCESIKAIDREKEIERDKKKVRFKQIINKRQKKIKGRYYITTQTNKQNSEQKKNDQLAYGQKKN